MTDELFTLRAIVASPCRAHFELFERAAASCAVPVEIIAAEDATAACAASAAGADLVFIDGELGAAATEQVVAAARAARNPSFTILLVGSEDRHEFAADAATNLPARFEEAQALVERSIRVRLTSRVLVVDDSATMRSIVRKLLAATRFPLEVSEAADGLAALQLIRDSRFDLAFLDYNMPEFNGLETLAEFKRENYRVSVVVMTSMQDGALAERTRDLGAAFLKKPFFPSDIEAVLCRYYGLQALNPKRG